jgi:hypothetical protein
MDKTAMAPNTLILPILRSWLADIIPEIWTEKDIEKDIRENCKNAGIDFPSACRLLRYVLLGEEHSPSVFLVMYALGRDETMLRIKRHLGVAERFMAEHIIDWRNVYDVGLGGLTVIPLADR